ncbi:MAG: sigma-54-dependent Fis family transcriptional regulator, partial [Calditrichaeota bacterium]
VRAGTFREDLYFRLNVVPIVSPPLRRRKEDIPILVQSFIESYARENGVRTKQVSAEAMQALRNYDWPGNIRELKNMVERLMIMCAAEVIDVADLPGHIQTPVAQIPLRMEAGMTLKEVRESVEREYIRNTLKSNNWNISQAAKALDIDRTNLHKKIKYYGLTETE